MTSKTKKLLSMLASTLVLSGFSADTVLNTTPTVSAAKHHKKKHHAKKKTSKQKTNKQSKQVKSTQNQSNTNNSNTNLTASNDSSGELVTTVKPQRDYSSLADWYADNGSHLYNKYRLISGVDSDAYRAGYSDGGEFKLNPSNYTNEIYKEGWMSGFLYDETDPNSGSVPLGGKSVSGEYSRAINTFNNGVALIQQKNNSHYIYIDLDNQWKEADY